MAGKQPKAGAHGKGDKRQPVPELQATFFLSLILENVRCFGPKQTLDLSDGKGRPAQWTILLGENGAGKATVLQTLVAFTTLSHPDQQPKTLPPIPHGMRWDTARPSYALFREGSSSLPHLKVELACRSKLRSERENHVRYGANLSVIDPVGTKVETE
jgi:hypothetical protein